MTDLAERWPLAELADLRDDAAGGLRRPEPRLPRHAPPGRGARPARRARRNRRLLRPGRRGLAAWFHDAVYDGERDAEERSAVWAEEALADTAYGRGGGAARAAHRDPRPRRLRRRRAGAVRRRPGDPRAPRRSATTPMSPGSGATTHTSPTPTSPPAARPCSTTWPAAAGCSTRRTRGRPGSPPPAPTWSASWPALSSLQRVEAEGMSGRVEHDPDVVLRLVRRDRGPELDRMLDGRVQVGHLDLEMQLHARATRLRRPDRRLVVLRPLDAERADALAEVEVASGVVLAPDRLLQDLGPEHQQGMGIRRLEGDPPPVLALPRSVSGPLLSRPRISPPLATIACAAAARRRAVARSAPATSHRHRTGGDDRVVPLRRDVVVVAVEAALRDAQGPGERVQLGVRRVAGEVRPQVVPREGTSGGSIRIIAPPGPARRPPSTATSARSRRRRRPWPNRPGAPGRPGAAAGRPPSAATARARPPARRRA